MSSLKIAVVIAVAIILQTSLPRLWPYLVYIDLPLIVVVYFALKRDALQGLVIGAVAGLATDAVSGGLLGANGFSKTLTAYVIVSLATRIMIDNPLARIPVLAGAALFDTTIYVLLHRMLGQPSLKPFVEAASFKLIGTTLTGTLLFHALERFFGVNANQRRHFATRRRVARRGLMRRR